VLYDNYLCLVAWLRTSSKFIASLHDQIKSSFLEGRILSIQSEQSENFSKIPDWLKKAGPPKKTKKPLLF